VTSPILTGPAPATARATISVAAETPQGGPASRSPSIASLGDRWPKVEIRDPVTRDATRRALDGAASWLSGPRCSGLFTEFHDGEGRLLSERLRQLGATPRDYLHLVYFHDGERLAACKREGVLAFTEVGGRMIYVCGRDFARAWNREPREILATLIHEMLHSLGLGENPPTPRAISYRVQQLCWQ
jgi:hypothetical protein